MRYVLPLCLSVGATVWVGVEYIGLGSAGTELEAQSSTCVITSSAGETACSTVAAAVLESLDDGNQNSSQLADPADAGSASEPESASVFTSNVGTGLVNSSNPDLRSLSAKPLSKEALGEFIDVDSELMDYSESTGFSEESIGIFIDVDADSDLVDVFDNEQSLGNFIGVEVGSGIVDSGGNVREAIGAFIEIDPSADIAPSDELPEEIGPIIIVDSI